MIRTIQTIVLVARGHSPRKVQVQRVGGGPYPSEDMAATESRDRTINNRLDAIWDRLEGQ